MKVHVIFIFELELSVWPYIYCFLSKNVYTYSTLSTEKA